MAKGEEEPLMSPGEMKPLLILSKKQPINCAIGMTRAKMGVILLSKKGKPRKMLGMLKTQAVAAKLDLDTASCRFGKAVVDTEVDSQLVQFIVNKDVSGALRPLLIKQLKLAGFGKCEISVDEGLEAETDEDETEGDGEEAAPAAAAPAEEVETAEDVDAGAAEAEPAEAAADAPATSDAAIAKRFTDLVKRMMAALGSKPAGADVMRTAAMEGLAALKAGDLEAATAAADTLERLLDAVPDGSAFGPGSAVFGKAHATWVATRKKVESEIDKLHDQLQATYKGHGVVADLEKIFRQKVEPIMEQFDDTLADKLDEVSKTTDPATHAALVAEAKQIIERYKGFLANEPLIDKLDSNPFVPLSIEKTLLASLTVLSKTVV